MKTKSIFCIAMLLMGLGVLFQSQAVYALDSASKVPAGLSAEDTKRLNAEKENLDFSHDDLQDRMDFLQDNCQGPQADSQDIIKCSTAEQFVRANETMYNNRLETYESEIKALQSNT